MNFFIRMTPFSFQALLSALYGISIPFFYSVVCDFVAILVTITIYNTFFHILLSSMDIMLYNQPYKFEAAKKIRLFRIGMGDNMTLKERAKKLKQDIPIVFLSLKDKETPILAKIFAGITVVYALSPIDLIPDFIPMIGYLDDIIILPALILLTIKLIPQNVWERNTDMAKDMWKDGKPEKWYYSIPIILLWIIILWLIIQLFWL